MISLKFTAILVGAVLTNLLTRFAGISPVVAAASVALVFAGLVLTLRMKSANDYLPLMYMGTFAGMSSLDAAPLPLAVLTLVAASGIAVIVTQLLAKHLVGVGGKLGLIAFVAGVPAMAAQGLMAPGKDIPVDASWIIGTTLMAGVVLFLSIRLRRVVASPVGISALISLAGALTPFPALIMSASFAGMSADAKLAGGRTAFVALAFALVYGLAFGLVQGVGGWLGLLACVSVFVVMQGERLLSSIRTTLRGVGEAA